MNPKIEMNKYIVVHSEIIEAEGFWVDEKNCLRLYVYDEEDAVARDYVASFKKWRSIRVALKDE